MHKTLQYSSQERLTKSALQKIAPIHNPQSHNNIRKTSFCWLVFNYETQQRKNITPWNKKNQQQKLHDL